MFMPELALCEFPPNMFSFSKIRIFNSFCCFNDYNEAAIPERPEPTITRSNYSMIVLLYTTLIKIKQFNMIVIINFTIYSFCKKY